MITLTPQEKRNMKLRQAYKALLASPDNHKHFTLTFTDGTPDKTALDAISHVIRCVNKALFGRNYKQLEHYVNGFCVKERSANHTLHFHCIFRFSKRGLKMEHSERLFPILNHAIHTLTNLNEHSPKPITGHRGWSLQNYYHDRLEDYVLKGIRKCEDGNLITDHIGLLAKNGVIFN